MASGAARLQEALSRPNDAPEQLYFPTHTRFLTFNRRPRLCAGAPFGCYTVPVLDTFVSQLQREGFVTLSIRARPNAPRTMIKNVMDDGSVKIDLAAPAEEGKANEELVCFLAEEFDVHSSQIELLSGGGNRRKLVRITRSV